MVSLLAPTVLLMEYLFLGKNMNAGMSDTHGCFLLRIYSGDTYPYAPAPRRRHAALGKQIRAVPRGSLWFLSTWVSKVILGVLGGVREVDREGRGLCSYREWCCIHFCSKYVILLRRGLIFPSGKKCSSTPLFIKEKHQVLGKLINMLSIRRIQGVCFSDLLVSSEQNWPPGSGRVWYSSCYKWYPKWSRQKTGL